MSGEYYYTNNKIDDLTHVADDFVKVNPDRYQSSKSSPNKEQFSTDVINWEHRFVFPITDIIIPKDLFPGQAHITQI